MRDIISVSKLGSGVIPEESGYDSDTTRKSGSTPRGSVNSDMLCGGSGGSEARGSISSELFTNTESEARESLVTSDVSLSCCDPSDNDSYLSLSCHQDQESPYQHPTLKPRMKKPPRKSREMRAGEEVSTHADKKRVITSTGHTTTASPTNNKSFKMFKLFKPPSSELGIIISRKRNSNQLQTTSGYEIAHIDPGGLVHRYTSNTSENQIFLHQIFF